MIGQICGQSSSRASRIAKVVAMGRCGSAMWSTADTIAGTPVGNRSDLRRWLHSLMLLVTPPASPPICAPHSQRAHLTEASVHRCGERAPAVESDISVPAPTATSKRLSMSHSVLPPLGAGSPTSTSTSDQYTLAVVL